MKHTKKITALLVLVFLAHQLFGLFIVSNALKELGTEYSSEELSIEAIFFPILLIIASAAFIILSRFKKLISFWHASALVLCGFITFSALMEPTFAIILSVVVLLLRKSAFDQYFTNISEFIIYPAIAIVFLPALNLLSGIVLLIIVSVYDLLAVYYSKHMIVLAKTQIKADIFSGIRINYGKESAIIGGGDIAFVMILVCLILRDYSLFNSIVTAVFSSLGLFLMLVLADKKKFYPAMPILTASSVIGFFFSILLTGSL